MARTPTYSATVLADKPVGYWRCDSTSSFADSSASSLPAGTVFNASLTPGLLAGDTNQALSFTGATNSHADLSDSSALDFTTEITLEAWVKPSAVTGAKGIIYKNGQYLLQLNYSAPEVVLSHPTLGDSIYRASAPGLAAGVAYHLVFSANAYRSFWCINGVVSTLNAPTIATSLWPGLQTTTNNLRVGGIFVPASFYNGTIDEVAVYNYALSEEQAFSHYIAGSVASPGPPATVVEVAFGSAATASYYTAVVSDIGGERDEDVGHGTYYRCGDIVGATTLNKTAGGAPDGVVHGTVTFGQTGAITGEANTAALFDGSTGYITIADGTGLLASNPVTHEVWVKLAALPGSRAGIIVKPHCLALSVLSSGKIEFVVTNTAGTAVTATSTGTIGTGAYHHLAATYDGANIRLYIDGLFDSLLACTLTPDVNANSVVIGADTTGPTNLLNGTLDEIALYNIALSADRIALHYAARVLQRPLVWTDISTYVRSYSVNAGRQHELDRYEAATATLVLKNTDRRFEPGFAASPYYPNIVPYKQLRIWETKDGIRFPVFTGWIERWPEAWQGPTYNEVTIDCVDAFDLFATNDFPAAALPATAPTAKMLEEALYKGASWDVENYPVLSGGELAGVSMVKPSSDPANVLTVCRGSEDTEGGEFYMDRRGRPVFRLRGSRTGTPSLATLGDLSPEVRYTNLKPSIDKDRIVNDVHVTPQGGVEQVATDYDSVVAYGRRSHTLSSYNATNADALALAIVIRDAKKTPTLRFEELSLAEGAASDNAVLVQILVRQIGDRITVRRRPDPTNKATNYMQQDCLISHIQITRSAQKITAQWRLVPAP